MTLSVPRETLLNQLRDAVLDENRRQNLIAASTIADFQTRHIDDSLQIVPLIGAGAVVDIGSGAGFPGLVLACALNQHVHLVEPRRSRASFLLEAASQLGLGNVTVHTDRIERLRLPPVSTITARAVARLTVLFELGASVASGDTRWVLLKGRSVESELAEARSAWHGEFTLVPSQTDPAASIVVATGIRRRRLA